MAQLRQLTYSWIENQLKLTALNKTVSVKLLLTIYLQIKLFSENRFCIDSVFTNLPSH